MPTRYLPDADTSAHAVCEHQLLLLHRVRRSRRGHQLEQKTQKKEAKDNRKREEGFSGHATNKFRKA